MFWFFLLLQTGNRYAVWQKLRRFHKNYIKKFRCSWLGSLWLTCHAMWRLLPAVFNWCSDIAFRYILYLSWFQLLEICSTAMFKLYRWHTWVNNRTLISSCQAAVMRQLNVLRLTWKLQKCSVTMPTQAMIQCFQRWGPIEFIAAQLTYPPYSIVS